MLALLITNVQELLQNTRHTKLILAWLILGSLAQDPTEIHFLIDLGLPRRKKDNVLQAHPQLLHPILKSPTSPIFRMFSSLTFIQNTDLDMPTPKQATTSTS
eukprot:82088-Pelagomonas_calceolata.AAC.1